MNTPIPVSSHSPSVSYAQISELQNSAKTMGNTPKDLQQAAEHFESVFIDMWLKAAREANQVFANDNFLNTSAMTQHQEMLDHEMAVHMAKSGGIGLAPIIVRQLQGEAGRSEPTPNIAPTGVVKRQLAMLEGADEHMRSGQDNEQYSMAKQSLKPNTASSNEVDVTHNAVSAIPGTEKLQTISVANNTLLNTNEKLLGRRRVAFDSPKSFVEHLLPMVKRVVQPLGLPPLAVLGQAALETGWGKQIIASADNTLSHNLFGMKAPSHGVQLDDQSGKSASAIQVRSKEYISGEWINPIENFRAYPDWSASIEDYANTITQSSRYANAVKSQTDVGDYARALQASGYATDPNYADKIVRVVETITRILEP